MRKYLQNEREKGTIGLSLHFTHGSAHKFHLGNVEKKLTYSETPLLLREI